MQIAFQPLILHLKLIVYFAVFKVLPAKHALFAYHIAMGTVFLRNGNRAAVHINLILVLSAFRYMSVAVQKYIPFT